MEKSETGGAVHRRPGGTTLRYGCRKTERSPRRGDGGPALLDVDRLDAEQVADEGDDTEQS